MIGQIRQMSISDVKLVVKRLYDQIATCMGTLKTLEGRQMCRILGLQIEKTTFNTGRLHKCHFFYLCCCTAMHNNGYHIIFCDACWDKTTSLFLLQQKFTKPSKHIKKVHKKTQKITTKNSLENKLLCRSKSVNLSIRRGRRAVPTPVYEKKTKAIRQGFPTCPIAFLRCQLGYHKLSVSSWIVL